MVKEVVPLLHASGNYQWDDEYPTESDFRKDIAADVLWVAYDIAESKLAGVAAIITDQAEEYGDAGLDVTQVAIVPHRLAVSPSYRGRGIAQGLMQKAEEEARSRGISLLRVDTNVLNHPMQHIFTKLGYQYKGDMSFKFKPETYGKMRFCCFEKILP